jgi:septin family protein
MRLLVFIIFFHSLASQDLLPSLLEETSLSVELKQADGSIKTQDLIEFINEGKLKMSTLGCQKKAIMVLGLTGVGKSTLVNYLNDIPLKCTRINSNWRIDLANPNVTLDTTCGFKIGHKNSETLYPSACTPNDKQVTYIDTPGFQDNRGFEIEIGNSFFRHEIIRQVDELKFLVLLNHADVIDRRVQFFDTVKNLQILGFPWNWRFSD